MIYSKRNLPLMKIFDFVNYLLYSISMGLFSFGGVVVLLLKL